MTAEEFKTRREKALSHQTLAARALGVTKSRRPCGRPARQIPNHVGIILDSLEKNPEEVNAIVNKSKTVRGTKKGGG